MNFVFYVLVFKYINSSINKLMDSLSQNFMGFAGGVALTLVTIWIMIQGFRIVTGQSREPMMGFVVHSMRIVLIVSTATTLGVFGSDLHTLFTDTLQTGLNQTFTGSTSNFQTTIDDNLAWTAFAEAAIDGIQTAPGDDASVAAKSRAADFAIFGTASPPMAAGAMLLMYNLAIALFVGLGPIFILCLLFEQTKPLFHKWLMYGIGTLFSMAMLSFVTGIVLSVTLRVASALWATSAIDGLVGATSEGLTTQSMEQGGIGLLMTLLLISAPPMAGNFFSATLGNFSPFSNFGGGAGAGGAAAAGRPGPMGQPAGGYGGGGYGGQGPSQASTRSTSDANQAASGFNPNIGLMAGQKSPAPADVVKPAPPTKD
jgi:type IV secretion system protein VirB6